MNVLATTNGRKPPLSLYVIEGVDHLSRFVRDPEGEVDRVASLVIGYVASAGNKTAVEGRNSPLRGQVNRSQAYINTVIEAIGLFTGDGVTVPANRVSEWGVEWAIVGVDLMLKGDIRRGLLVYTVGGCCDVGDGQRARTEVGGYLYQLWYWGCGADFSSDDGPIIDGTKDREAEGGNFRQIIDACYGVYGTEIDSDDTEWLDDLPLVVWLSCLARALAETYKIFKPENGENAEQVWGTSLGRRLIIPKLALMIARRAPWFEVRGKLRQVYDANFLTARARIEELLENPLPQTVLNEEAYRRHRGYYAAMVNILAKREINAGDFLVRNGLGILIPQEEWPQHQLAHAVTAQTSPLAVE